jgi:hypothetical protein
MGAAYRERSATVQPADEANPSGTTERLHVVLDLAADPSVMTPEQRLAAFGQLLARALYRATVGANRDLILVGPNKNATITRSSKSALARRSQQRLFAEPGENRHD